MKNPSEISEAFGQQIEILTAGTKYEIDPETEKQMDHTERKIREVMYNLWMDAQSNKLAVFLEKGQAAHFENLYEFSYGTPLYDQNYSISKSPENIAIRIIAEKQRYVNRIRTLRSRYERFKEIVDKMDQSTKEMLIGYFVYSYRVDYELLRPILCKHLREIEKVYKRCEEKQEAAADQLEDEYQALLGKKRYVVDRKIIYMTDEEQNAHVENEKQKREKLYKRLGMSEW